MIIEQAFYNLPEIMTGSGFANQDVEAGIVASMSLALLQELNGRNVPLPISVLYAEKRFAEEVKDQRCDLYVDLWRKLYVGSENYSAYGFRFFNWIEAKFFRHKSTKTQNTSLLLADLIRLVALPEEKGDNHKLVDEGDETSTGRYMLHVYKGDPTQTTVLIDDILKDPDEQVRPWLISLVTAGNQSVVFPLKNETKDFFKNIGTEALRDVVLTMDVNNRVIEPIPDPISGLISDDHYKFVLTRIIRARLEFNGIELILGDDRKFRTDPAGKRKELREAIAGALKTNKPGPQTVVTGTPLVTTP